jgi:hypothetical protein
MPTSCSSINKRTLHRSPEFFHPVDALSSERERPSGPELSDSWNDLLVPFNRQISEAGTHIPGRTSALFMLTMRANRMDKVDRG